MFQNSIDWLEFSIPMGTSILETIDELNFYLESDFVTAERGMLGYDSMLVTAHEAKVLSSSDSRHPEHHVILPGKWCRSVGTEKLIVLASWVVNHKGSFSRVDFACDDYASSRPDMRRIFKSCQRGQLVSHAQKANAMLEFRGGSGTTLNIGSRKSERFLRIYDKNAESKGEINCTRYEIMMRNENADTAINMLLDNQKNLFERLLIGMADFREVKGKNVTRRDRLPWFKKLVDNLKRAEFYKAKAQITVSRMENWIRKQVAPSMACVLAKCQGDMQIFEDICTEGKERWRSQHRLALALA